MGLQLTQEIRWELMNLSFDPRDAFLTDDEVRAAVRQREDQSYEQLPDWLQYELQTRNLYTQAREPTLEEIWETNRDWIEYRKQCPETLEDLRLKYNI